MTTRKLVELLLDAPAASIDKEIIVAVRNARYVIKGIRVNNNGEVEIDAEYVIPTLL